MAPDGTVWVADTQNNRLVHLSANLTDLGDGFGSLGNGNTQFFNPHDLAFGNDKMYVADTYNNRVQMFSMPGPTEPPPADLDAAVPRPDLRPGRRGSDLPGRRRDRRRHLVRRRLRRQPRGHHQPHHRCRHPADRDRCSMTRATSRSTRPTRRALWVIDTGGNRVVRIARTGGAQLGTRPRPA